MPLKIPTVACRPMDAIRIGNNFRMPNAKIFIITLHIVTPMVRILDGIFSTMLMNIKGTTPVDADRMTRPKIVVKKGSFKKY